MAEVTKDAFWTLIDEHKSSESINEYEAGIISTYEHVLSNGVLVLTEHRWADHISSSMVFVPK